jgi:hypothetical protein
MSFMAVVAQAESVAAIMRRPAWFAEMRNDLPTFLCFSARPICFACNPVNLEQPKATNEVGQIAAALSVKSKIKKSDCA